MTLDNRLLRTSQVLVLLTIMYAANSTVALGAQPSSQSYVQEAQASSQDTADALVDRITSTFGKLSIDAACNDPTAKLRIKDTEYEHGWSHHASDDSSLFVPLDGQYKIFESEIGIQWQGGNSYPVVEFLVYVDDKLVFESGIVHENDPPRKISIPVEGADMLRLVATVAGNGGDGLANWAEARLIPDPAPKTRPSDTPVDIAAFARIVTSDPKRMAGTAASRVEEFPAEDISLETDLQPNTDGSYAIPIAADGSGCIGLRWHEIRFPRCLELRWSADTILPPAEAVQLQYWGRLPYASPWQGDWKPLRAKLECDDHVWRWQIAQGDLPLGTIRVRWVFSNAREPLVLESLSAYSRSSWTTADLKVELQHGPADKQAHVVVYNGDLLESSGIARSCPWDLSQPLTLRVRYSKPRTRKEDRTLLRFELPEKTISVAVEDVVSGGCVYVPSAGLFVTGNPPRMTLSEYLAGIADKKTVLEQVREQPDQSLAQAMAKTHNPIQNLGPMLISLTCDNRKFVVSREGGIQFDLYDVPDGDYKTERFWDLVDPKQTYYQLAPQFGGGKGEVERHLDGGWLPKPVTTVTENGVKYRQCTYVAPVDEKAPEGCPNWYRQRALCVVEYSIENTLPTETDVALTLTLLKDRKNVTLEGLQEVEESFVAVEKDRLLAFFDARQSSPLRLAKQGDAVGLTGKLAAGKSARLVVYLPAWPVKPAEYAVLGNASEWAVQTDRYWKDMLAGAMQIEIPDPLLANVIRASQVHCLLTARNEERGNRIVPWVSSIWYAAWGESEAQSIIRGMDMLGHADFARRALEHFLKGYNAKGFLTKGFTTVGTGENLWVLAEHLRRSGDQEWLKTIAPDLVRACNWIVRQRAKTKRQDIDGNNVPEYGLMPPGVTADWGRYCYKFFNDIQYYHGLEAVARELAMIGHPDAPALLADAKEYQKDLLRAYRWTQSRSPVVPLQNGTWVPNHPALLDVFGNVEEMLPVEDIVRTWSYSAELGSHHLAANRILDPTSDEVAQMMNYLEDYQFLRSGWYDYPEERNRKDVFNLGGFGKMEPYFGRNAEIYAMRDDVKPFLRSYLNTISSVLSEESLSVWEHFNNTSAWNKTSETAWFLCQTATMFVMERNDELWLAPMVTNRWLEDGKKIEVRNAPTRFGLVSYDITSAVANGQITAEIQPPTRAPFKHLVLRVRHPQDQPIRAVTINGKPHQDFEPRKQCINIPPTTEHITVHVTYY